ncbi:Cell division protein FtsZ [bioreactor metagenome]|uniref:Cell division protein FtsZ n=1 Tax=bioreactor metagenome TaxID=1076179 RepID=A0A645FT56_9ZZZZ
MQQAAHPEALIIFGAAFDESLQDEIHVTVIATGFEETAAPAPSNLFTKAGAKVGESASSRDKSAPAPAAPQPEPEDDPFEDIFKIFNRER